MQSARSLLFTIMAKQPSIAVLAKQSGISLQTLYRLKNGYKISQRNYDRLLHTYVRLYHPLVLPS